MSNTINYNNGFVSAIINYLFDGKGRYFEPNMKENNYIIAKQLSDNYKLLINENDYDKYKSLDNVHKLEKYSSYNFKKCDAVFVGQTMLDEKFNSLDHEFLSKYNNKNIKTFNSQFYNIFLGLEKLSNDGIMIINIPSTCIYRNDNFSICLRKYLIDNKLIKGIALIKGTCEISEFELVLVISKKENNNIVFVDAKNNDYKEFYSLESSFGGKESNELRADGYSQASGIFSLINYEKNLDGISSVVDYNTIINNDYNLIVGNYVKSKRSIKHRKLSDIAWDINVTLDKIQEKCGCW